ncbi:hypothetical protein CAEBREN_04870 [Caenorhabditis brenneri]|uniref:Nuclear receptor domain-containing protein n=1 Tax=Caenorhabditis brenneri TaxID=135651 RepID=G0P338_CAEBE|nr:hypothetical protein CAEBREN_04870 [Caenorhabditis brenneri]
MSSFAMLSSTTSPEKENMNGPCKVCDKPSNGLHYGVRTCDSCKCFFARSLKKSTESLVCSKDSNCDLSGRQPKTICSYCRFQKCVKVGMTSISYQYRPESLVQRALTPNDMVPLLPSPSSSLQSSELMEMNDDLLTETFNLSKLTELQEISNIVNSYKEGCCFTAEKIKGLELKEFKMVISQNAELTLVKAWTDYAEEIEADIRALLPFIDDLQDSFNSHDKAILLKRSAFQIYLLRRIRALNPYGLLLSDGRVIKLISLQFLYGIQLINEMLQVNPENLSSAQQKFKKLFMKHAESRGVDQRVFQNLIELWPELEKLKVMHQERLEILKPYRWAFPENSLFAEVYDLDPQIVTFENESNLSSDLLVSNGFP